MLSFLPWLTFCPNLTSDLQIRKLDPQSISDEQTEQAFEVWMESPKFSNRSFISSAFGCYLHPKSPCSIGNFLLRCHPPIKPKNTAPGLAHIWSNLKEGGKSSHPVPRWFYSLTGKQHISLIFSHVTQVFEDRILWVDWLFGCYRVAYFLVQLPCLGVVCHFHNNFHGNFLRPPGNAKHAILGHRKTWCTRKMQKIFYFKAGMVTETWIGHSWTSNMISTQPMEPWSTTSLATTEDFTRLFWRIPMSGVIASSPNPCSSPPMLNQPTRFFRQ